MILVGQKLPSGTAAAGELVRMSGVGDAVKKAGAGSMLAQMAARYRKIDQVFDVYLLPYADNPAGVAAHGTITVTAPATDAGTLALYVAGRLVSVGITTDLTTAAIATTIAAAITATDDMPVKAVANASTVTLTALHKGTCGNGVDLRLNLYGEVTPENLGLTLTAMSGDPVPGDLSQILGQQRYWYVSLGITDAATLAAWGTEADARYLPPFQAGFRGFTAHRGDYAAAVAFGETKNYEHIADLSLGVNPTSPWEAAAMLAAAGPQSVQQPGQFPGRRGPYQV